VSKSVLLTLCSAALNGAPLYSVKKCLIDMRDSLRSTLSTGQQVRAREVAARRALRAVRPGRSVKKCLIDTM